MRLIPLIFSFIFLPVCLLGATLNDFEDGNATNNGGTNGYFYDYENDNTNGPDPQTTTILTNQGANGTAACASVSIDGSSDPDVGSGQAGPPGLCYFNNLYYGNLYIYETSEAKGVPFTAASGCNRMSFFIKLPTEYNQHPNNGGTVNGHVGTYSHDPGTAPGSDGAHFYHWFNIPGSTDYWTKIVINEHPQHRTGSDAEVGDNPTQLFYTVAPYNYMENLTKFYVDMSLCSSIGGYTAYLDEFIFYTASEAENDASIATISCSYFGSGVFQLNWRGAYEYLAFSDTYDVYWSTSPITNANYTSATKINASPIQKQDASGYLSSWYKLDCTIAATSGTVYFAIKDRDDESTVVSKIDYAIDETPAPVAATSKYTITGGTCTGCQ